MGVPIADRQMPWKMNARPSVIHIPPMATSQAPNTPTLREFQPYHHTAKANSAGL
jgi:hypothetical protein